MARSRRTITLLVLVTISISAGIVTADDASNTVRFEQGAGRIGILIDDHVFATYVFDDSDTPRPYFSNLYAPCAVKVTRSRPPGPDDLSDHPHMHPGLWLAFGDLNGNDYWRLKARIEHVELIEEPTGGKGRGTFTVRNRYHAQTGSHVVCDEVCRYTIIAKPTLTTILWDSRFRPADSEPIVFGDQEEMGLGVRLASDIAEKQNKGGLLTNSEGQTSAANVWGQPADWCDYSGIVEGQPVGVTIAGHPDNFRTSWWHARDYGFMAANPFGRAAMKQGESSRLEVKPGDKLRLRFAVTVHNSRPGDGYDPAAHDWWSEAVR